MIRRPKVRYLIDLLNNKNEKIQDIIKQGKYQNVAEFINAAIENQLYLENSSNLVLEEYSPNVKNLENKTIIEESDLISLLSRDIGNIETINPPENNRIIFPSRREGSDANTWIWGQINKIFPIKIGLRVLGNMIKQNKEPSVDIDTFTQKASDVARWLGFKLLVMENKEKRKREGRISLGLPIGEPKYTSETRYKNHFLISVRRDGMLDGALARYKFININKNNKKPSIGITKDGLKYALLENPIIDKNKYSVSLSDEEKDFYIKHIASKIPGEYKAIKWILSIIKKGTNRREDINRALGEKYSEWSEPIVNTQRAGLMARMFELGLLDREKHGVKVIYKNSVKGENI